MVAAGVLCAGGAAGKAWSQESSDAPVEPVQEVVVTAERTETALRRTPVSAVVIGLPQLQAQGIVQLADLPGVAAGVVVPNGFSNMPQAVGIRGVGVSIPAMSQAVGIYVDDVPLIRGYATALWDLPDIERIEVLRGPQGTLHGQNLTAGAIKLVSMDPAADPVAWLSASAGNRGALEGHGYLNGPLGDDGLLGSLAFSRRVNDGFARNATLGKDVNKLDVSQFRAKLRLPSTSGWDGVLSLDGLQDRSDANTTNFPLNAPNPSPRVTFTSVEAGAFERLAGGVSLRLTNRLADGLLMRSITAYRGYRDDPTVADWGGLVEQRFTLSQVVQQEAFSQELQLQGSGERLRWTAGVMLASDRFDFDRFSTVTPPGAPAATHSEAKTHQQTTDAGLYAQGRYAWTPDTGLTAGARVYRTRQTGSNEFWLTDADQVRTVQVYAAPDLSTAKTGLLPKVGIDHQWDENLFVYASIARGAKFGGFNRAAQSAVSARVAARPENVTTYEAGLKARSSDGALSIDTALFYNDYRDYLASLTNLTLDGVLVTDAVLVNAGAARTYGIDVDLAARLGRSTDLTLSIEALRSRFDRFANPTGAPEGDYVGHELPYAPRLSLGAGLRHQLFVGEADALSLGGSVRYLAGQYSDPANSALLRIPSQTYVDLDAVYTPAGQRWTFSLRIRNLLDKTYVLLRNRIPPLGVDAAFYNAPRTALLTARHDF